MALLEARQSAKVAARQFAQFPLAAVVAVVGRLEGVTVAWLGLRLPGRRAVSIGF